MTVFYDAAGMPSRYPTTHLHALEIKSPLYNDGVKCSECGQMSIKYTHDHSCRWCTRLDAMDFYNLAVGSKFVITSENDGKHYGVLAGGTLRPISDDKYQEMVDLICMGRGDTAFTFHTDPCDKKAHYGFKRLGRCYQCTIEKNKPTPRRRAMMDGKTWYTPATPCVYCHTIALKNVHNGSCQGCTPTKQTESVDTLLMRDNPEMEMTRDDARTWGFKVYRTGNPCRSGHTGWRYVSTGNCIDCIKRI